MDKEKFNTRRYKLYLLNRLIGNFYIKNNHKIIKYYNQNSNKKIRKYN